MPCLFEVDFSSSWHQIPATILSWPFGFNHLLIFDLSGFLESTSYLTQLLLPLAFSSVEASGKGIAALVLSAKDCDSLDDLWRGEKVLNIHHK